MNDRQRIALAHAGGDRLRLLGDALDVVGSDSQTVMARMRDAQGGLRARNYEATGGNRRHDVVGADAARVDRARQDEIDLDRCIETAVRCINRAWAIASSYPPAHQATASERRSLGLYDTDVCESCARTTGSDGSPRCEPIHEGLAGGTDVGGRLERPALLCRWCYGAVRDWGRLPTTAEVERHHVVGRVPWPDDVPRPA
jgi:hypothetical protein